MTSNKVLEIDSFTQKQGAAENIDFGNTSQPEHGSSEPKPRQSPKGILRSTFSCWNTRSPRHNPKVNVIQTPEISRNESLSGFEIVPVAEKESLAFEEKTAKENESAKRMKELERQITTESRIPKLQIEINDSSIDMKLDSFVIPPVYRSKEVTDTQNTPSMLTAQKEALAAFEKRINVGYK